MKIETTTAHPFELSGLGVGPFRFLYVASFPSPALAETNPDAYQTALRDLPRDVKLGICDHCGMVLMHNFVCESSDGRKFCVGSQCVAKTSDRGLGDKVAIAAAKIVRDARRAKADAKHEARRAAWLIANAPRLEARAKAQAEREAAAAVEREVVTSTWAFLLPVLDSTNGGFCASIASDIRAGHAPQGRAVDILQDIFAKTWGKRGSAAYLAAAEDFTNRTQA